MTRQRRLKNLVRERMKQTGERYAAARRFVIAGHPASDPCHLPGSIATTTVLRILATQAGILNPKTQQPFSEAMLFGIAGGVGIGVFSFFYEKEGFASFFVGGRRLWHDAQAYLSEAAERLGATCKVLESSSPKAAEKQLREMLAAGPTAAWVDMTHLPHRGMPAHWSGMGYHLVAVYRIDEAAGAAWIGDLGDEPIEISLADLATARGRIKKDKHRLMTLERGGASQDVASAVRAGIKACCEGLNGAGAPKQARRNFSLDALQTWAERLTSTNPKDPERWERVFAPGGQMWNGLTFLNLFVEYYGTGGGLCRPLMADFLSEAGKTLDEPALQKSADLYAELGRMWSDLAAAALPDGAAPLKEAKDLHAKAAELFNSNGGLEEKQAIWARLAELGAQVAKSFPLTPEECAALRAELAERVLAIHRAETAAQAGLALFIA